MANYYVKSGAAGAADGSSWANAYTTLAAALTARAAGDVFWVSHQHAETQAAAMSLISPGTAVSPCQILCVNDGAAPPTALAITATVSCTGNGSTMAISGFAYIYGIIFSVASGTNNANLLMQSTAPWWLCFERCTLKINSTGTTSFIGWGAIQTTADDTLIELVNTTFQFGATTQFLAPRCKTRWSGSLSTTAGTAPAVLFFSSSSGNSATIEVRGVNLSPLGSGKSLVALNIGNFSSYLFVDCQLGASVTITNGANIAGQGGQEVIVSNCDSANTKYRYYKENYQGIITQETTIVKTGGASDGTTTWARLLASSANTKFFSPLVTDWHLFWNESTSQFTITVPIISFTAALLTDAQVWLEVEYPGTASLPLGVFITDRAADVLAAAQNQATDSTAWTGTARANTTVYALNAIILVQGRLFICTTAGTSASPEPGGYASAVDGGSVTDNTAVFRAGWRQQLSVIITPAGKGPIYFRVCEAVVSTSIYADMKQLLS